MRHVHLYTEDALAGFLGNGSSGGVDAGFVDVGNQHPAAFAGEALGDSLAEPLSAAGDDGGFVLEVRAGHFKPSEVLLPALLQPAWSSSHLAAEACRPTRSTALLSGRAH